MLIYRRDLSERAVLLLGQGPSAWPLEDRRDELQAVREAGLLVAVCNRGYSTYPFDFCFAQDPVPVYELFQTCVHEHGALVVPDGAWLDWMHQGNERPPGLEDGVNFYTLGPQPMRSSTGVIALDALIRCHASSITLLGFDGSTDGRNRFLGQEGYRNKPTKKPTYVGWEAHSNSIVRQTRAVGFSPRLFHAPLTESEHPLDKSFERVSVDVLAHLQREVEECRRFASSR